MPCSNPRPRGARAGLSLVEAVITTTLFGVVLGTIVMATDSSARSFRTGSAVTDAQGRVRDVLSEIAGAFRTSDLDTVTPIVAEPLSSSRAELQRVEGYAGGAMVLGPTERFVLEYEDGELDDGFDNDGDGLVDECRIVRIENPGLADQRRFVLLRSVPEFLEGEVPGNGVDDNGNELENERGLCFTYDGSRVTIRVSIERVGPEGILITRTLETTVALRNTTTP